MLKETFWDNAEKIRQGDNWLEKKTYEELAQASGLSSGVLRDNFITKPKINIKKMMMLIEGLNSLSTIDVRISTLLVSDNLDNHITGEFSSNPEEITQDFWANLYEHLKIDESTPDDIRRHIMTNLVKAAGFKTTNYNLIKGEVSVNINHIEAFASVLNIEPYQLLLKNKGKDKNG